MKNIKNLDLFQIGEIAKMFHLSVGTIRFYEKNDLLKPEYVDKETGYRYFSPQQFECLNTIRYLRMLDMPTCKIREFLKNRDVSKIQQMLTEQKFAVIEKQKELKIIEKKIDNRLKYLKNALESELDKIQIKTVESKRIVWLKNNIEMKSYIDPNFETSIRTLEKNQKEATVFLGKVGLGISKELLLNKKYDCYDMVFLTLDDEDNFLGQVEELPQETCATIRFCGSHKDASKYYKKLINYIYKNDLNITGFSKEISMIDFGITNDINKFVTEIQIPIGGHNEEF